MVGDGGFDVLVMSISNGNAMLWTGLGSPKVDVNRGVI